MILQKEIYLSRLVLNLAGLDPGYGNEGDWAESGDQLSDEKSPMLYYSRAFVLLMRKTANIIWNRHTLLFMDKINQWQ
jgi:hypothetical protein